MSTKPLKDALAEAAAVSSRPLASDDEPLIDVQGPLRHLTAIYEKIRTLLDYQEERFLRRLAIRRILFRRLAIQSERKEIGEHLLRELIRAGYLENNKYPQSYAPRIDELLKKYLAILPVIERRYQAPELIRMQRRMMGFAAAEIEDLLSPPDIDLVLAERLAQEIGSYLGKDTDDDCRIIALRALTKGDAELVAWRLFSGKKSVETEANAIWKAFVAEPEKKVGDVLRFLTKLEYTIQHRDIETKVRRFQRLVPPYIILGELAYQEGKIIDTLAQEPLRLEHTLDQITSDRISRTETKLHGAMIRATIYIFLTKAVFGLGIEIPYDLASLNHVAILPLVINILVPPLLMVMAALSIRAPSQANNDLLVRRAEALLVAGEVPKLPELEHDRRRRPFASVIFSLFYAATYVVSFGLLIWLVTFLGFNWLSIIILIFFLSVVGFFAYRIRNTAKELAILREREGGMILVLDFFGLPFLRVGRWLSSTVRSINVFLFVFDFLIEAPLKFVLVGVEDWFAFLREKREELR